MLLIERIGLQAFVPSHCTTAKPFYQPTGHMTGQFAALNKPYIVVGCLTVLGALLRLYHLDYKSLWFDEAALYWIAHNPVQDVIAQNASSNSAPPLYALALSGIISLSESEAALRSLAWVGGVLAIPAIYLLSREFVERFAAYFVTLLVALAPTQIQYSQEVREYSLSFLTATLMLWLAHRHYRNPSWINWGLMTLIIVVGLFLQYGLALLLAAINVIYVLESLFTRTFSRKLWITWAAAQVVALIAVVAVIDLSLGQQMKIGFGSGPASNYLAEGYWSGSIASLIELAVINTYNIVRLSGLGSMDAFAMGSRRPYIGRVARGYALDAGLSDRPWTRKSSTYHKHPGSVLQRGG
jgi:uncharacterized membrane protein